MLPPLKPHDVTNAIATPAPERGFGVYVHWPFCLSKCPYCDFNSHVVSNIDHDQWADALVKELLYHHSETQEKKITSVFFGGGTPSLMAPKTVEKIIQTLRDNWAVDDAVEITLEANPTSVEGQKFKDFAAAGINRVSIGVQSFDEADLKFLGREHSVTEATRAIELAQQYFERFSFDLIHARPEQTLSAWEAELKRALSFAVGHISLYQLTIEQGTQFFTRYNRGDFKLPEEELAADFYEMTHDILGAKGLYNYEVSNFAKPGHESRHNLTYWRYGDYIGVGPGAHGRLTIGGDKYATQTHRAPGAWLKQVETKGHAQKPREVLSVQDRVVEQIMMGLRLHSGVHDDHIVKETGQPRDHWLPYSVLSPLVENGDMIVESDHIKLTLNGRTRLNTILNYLIDKIPNSI